MAVYDRMAGRYDRAIAPLERWFLKRLRAEALAELPANSRILEVGAGTGLNFPFYPRGARGVASELSYEMIKPARGKPHPLGVHLVQTSAERLPFQTDSFDAAFATLVFCSVASPHDALLEINRVVRPGGSIVLLEHVRPEGLLGYFFDALSILTVALFDDHFNRRTAWEAKSAGLQLVRVERRALGIFNLIICHASGKDER
jgi:phosphatidylethanolamine/phosphatidyl-N-methylethanolamine N-methyltransferase